MKTPAGRSRAAPRRDSKETDALTTWPLAHCASAKDTCNQKPRAHSLDRHPSTSLHHTVSPPSLTPSFDSLSPLSSQPRVKTRRGSEIPAASRGDGFVSLKTVQVAGGERLKGQRLGCGGLCEQVCDAKFQFKLSTLSGMETCYSEEMGFGGACVVTCEH